MPPSELEVRCSCRSEPLLAVAGKGSDGNGYVHIKTWKGNRLYVEVVVTSGTAHIRCRNCFRWHRIRIVKADVDVRPERLPETISV